jgi:hypothetical protein
VLIDSVQQQQQQQQHWATLSSSNSSSNHGSSSGRLAAASEAAAVAGVHHQQQQLWLSWTRHTVCTYMHAHTTCEQPTLTPTTTTESSHTAIHTPLFLLQPEFWLKTGLGGWTEEGTWVPGFEGYAPYFHRVASSLNPCDDPEGPQLSGPGWGESLGVCEGVSFTWSCLSPWMLCKACVRHVILGNELASA